jgi:hypothetical protein
MRAVSVMRPMELDDVFRGLAALGQLLDASLMAETTAVDWPEMSRASLRSARRS